jgi:hypothetical protein
MVDNTQVNSGSGDVIRDIDRGTAKTQVVQLDAGGASAESLVSLNNPLPVQIGNTAANAMGLPVDDTNLNAAQSSDGPLFATITGDPAGDFAGVNLLEEVIKDGTGLNLKVSVVNPPGKFDAAGAEILSDCAGPFNFVSNGSYSQIYDTVGYGWVSLTTSAMGSSVTAAWSNDGISFGSLASFYQIGGSILPAATISNSPTQYIGIVCGRYLRLTSSAIVAPNQLTFYLRSGAAPPQVGFGNLAAQTNITQIGNNSVSATAGVQDFNIARVGGSSVSTAPGSNTGVLSVGGPFTNASGLSVGPVIVGGYDSGTPGVTPTSGTKGGAATRQFLTDNTGRLRIAEEHPAVNAQNVTALAVQEVGQVEGQSRDELLFQILNELKVVSHLLFELPNLLNAGLRSTDEPATLRSDPTIFTQ